jgi:hypothetical protein
VPWMARITAVIDRHAGDTPRYRDGRWRAAFDASAGFTPLQLRRFPHRHELDREGLLDRFASISFVAALPDEARASVLAEIEQVVEAEPSLAGSGPVMVPYRTDLFTAGVRRRGGGASRGRCG